MMKTPDPLKIEQAALEALEAFLRNLPRTKIDRLQPVQSPEIGDIRADFHLDQELVRLYCEVKTSGQPRHVRAALDQLARIKRDRHSVVMVIAPYLSEQSRALCREDGAGYLDFEGNAFISAGSVHIEREVASQPKAEKRSLRSLFKPKSARILRRLLREPHRPWRVIELAKAAGVSVGHVSTIGSELKDREWLEQTDDGLVLTDPNGLLDAWATEYERPAGREQSLYTHLHGTALERAFAEATTGSSAGKLILRSYSAADHLAPFARNANRYLYADEQAMSQLISQMRLSTTEKGGNVMVIVPDEDGVFDDAVEPMPGIACTSPVQTYLDLQHSGERGREAADHLRQECLTWR
ncbi:hypothetical protein GL174_10525 [Sphingobium sp. CAP-1]|nr:hypothetical protein GL174_10525 [Sphingobium sp. CAP-1]